MSDTSFLIEIRITHELPLEADTQTIADLAARSITDALADDPKLLATARLADAGRGAGGALFMEGYSEGFTHGKQTSLRVIEGTMAPEHQLHIAADRSARSTVPA